MSDFSNLDSIFYDFDGVMTNNKFIMDQNGIELVELSRADGFGISQLKKLGYDQIIISTEKNPVVRARSKKLKITCYHGVKDKKKLLIEYCKKNKIKLSNTAFVGNDLNDLEVMKIVGFTFCPADANKKILEISDFIVEKKGGDGVIREILSIIKLNRS